MSASESPLGKMWLARLNGFLWTALPWAAPSWHSQQNPVPALGRTCSIRSTCPWCLPWARPAVSGAQDRVDLQAEPPVADRGVPPQSPAPAWSALEARPGAASKTGRLSPEPPAGSSLSARLARLLGAALRCAAPRGLQPGAGRGRWMPRLCFCCLPAGLRRPVSAGRRGRPLGDERDPVGQRSGLGPGRRAGGGARRLLLPTPVPWKQRPGLPAPVPGCAAKLGARDSGPTGRGGKGSPGPFCQLQGRGEAGQDGLQFGGIWGLGEPRWPRAAGWRLQPRA